MNGAPRVRGASIQGTHIGRRGLRGQRRAWRYRRFLKVVIRLPGQLDAPMMCRPVELAAFCVVASIAEQAAHGKDGLELRSGESQFPPGANWVLPAQWGRRE